MDRSRWDGCECCTGPVAQKEDIFPGLYIDGDGQLGIDGEDDAQILFCPKCGRPLAEEAWAMLQNRMEGR